jgi:hypothetical protein
MLHNGLSTSELCREGYLGDVEHVTWVAYLVHGRDSSVVGGLVLHSITPVGASRELAASWNDGRPPSSQGSQQTCTNPQHASLQCQWHHVEPFEDRWGRVLQNALKLS